MVPEFVHDVILVNENDEVLGTMEKMEAHQKGVLHRAFSVFILNDRGEMLLQQRATGKYHSAGLWTNACCSHPFPLEDTKAAAERRLMEEMGFHTPLKGIFNFIYNTPFDNGLTEYEYDHVFVGYYNGTIHPEAAEVADYCYKTIEEIAIDIQEKPQRFTSWFRIAFPKVEAWLQHQTAEASR
jgi:isopentenyl-diphosphate delta-isomerase